MYVELTNNNLLKINNIKWQIYTNEGIYSKF